VVVSFRAGMIFLPGETFASFPLKQRGHLEELPILSVWTAFPKPKLIRVNF